MKVLRLAFITRRGWLLLGRNFAVVFAALSGLLQLYLAVWPKSSFSHGYTLGGIIVVSLVWGVFRVVPRSEVSREFSRPDITVIVKVGDIFKETSSHLVIGYSDVFDTDMSDGVVISPRSVQGQFQALHYGGDTERLDAELGTVLADVPVVSTERPEDKRRGKLDRYPIGTVATLGNPARRFFCVAYTKMRNDLTAKSNVDHLWRSLSELWQAVHLHGQREAVAMPVVGSDLARINCLDRESLLKMILLSFVARSREEIVCKKLTIVIHKNDYRHINILEVAAFLRTL